MGFVVTTLIFAMVGVIASLMVRICCGGGASANLEDLPHRLSGKKRRVLVRRCFDMGNLKHANREICGMCGKGRLWLHLTLVITAVVCCWMMWAIVYLAQMKPLIVPILTEGE